MAEEEAQGRGPILRFEPFELDVVRHTLSRDGVRIKLQKQPFQVLELLVQRAPEIVTRADIRRHVWGDTIYVEEDQGINFCIRQIRLALGDTSAAARFVETLPKQGYRFVAPVEGVAPKAYLVAKPPPSKARNQVTARRWLIPTLGPLVTIAVLVAVWASFAKRDTVLSVVGLTPITTYPGSEIDPSLSPDGRQVAFGWDQGSPGTHHIWVQLLGEQHPLRLTNSPEGDRHPAWSPDGKHIAYIRFRTDIEGDIVLIPAIGGEERILHRIRLCVGINDSDRLLAWSPNGKSIVFTSQLGDNLSHVGLFLLSIESGEVKALFSQQVEGIGDSTPAFSPDGSWLAFARFSGPSNTTLMLQKLSPAMKPEGPAQIVRDTGPAPQSPVWMPDGKRIIFLEGHTRIMQAEVGGAAHLLHISSSRFYALTTARSELRILASRMQREVDIWTIALHAGGLKGAEQPKRILYSTAVDSQPRYSPDGRSLAFISERSGRMQVWVANSDGENPRQLTNLPAHIVGFARWSPDGQFLSFGARIPDVPQIYIVRVADGVVRQITHSRGGSHMPSWSTDGHTLYVAGNYQGQFQVARVPSAGGSPEPLWQGWFPVEAPSRNLLLYSKEDQFGLFARSLTGDPTKNPEFQLADDYLGPAGGIYPVNDGVYYTGFLPDPDRMPRAFRFYSFESGKSVDIAPAPKTLTLGLSVSPDRSHLTYSTDNPGNENVVQIDLR